MENILISGGIGDVLAIESHMTDTQRASVENIFYATRAHKVIKEILSKISTFPNIKNHIVLWEDFSKIFAFHSKNEVITALASRNKLTSQVNKNKADRFGTLLQGVKDYSISKIFTEIPNLRPYNNSSFLKEKVADISKFTLPERFFVICPYSPNDRRNLRRDFNEKDWENLIKILETKNTKGVILNVGNDPIPEHSMIMNLSNQTSFLESIEVMKKAKGYYGIDSSLSVLAAKLYDTDFMVKSNNSHCYVNKHIYYAPKKEFKFLKSSIKL